MAEQPPIGIMPRWLHDERRVEELLKAMLRYAQASKAFPVEWALEVLEYAQSKQLRDATHG